MAIANTLCLPEAKPSGVEYPLERTVLLVVDHRRELLSSGQEEIARQTVDAGLDISKTALSGFRTIGGRVLHVKDAAEVGDLPTPSVPEWDVWPGEVLFRKSAKCSTWSTGLHRALLARSITHIILAGIATPSRMTTMAKECVDRGFECVMVQDDAPGLASVIPDSSFYTVHRPALLRTMDDILKGIEDALPGVAATPNHLPPIQDLLSLYRQGATTPTDIVKMVYEKIEAYRTVDEAVWVSLRPKEDAMAEAKRLEQRYAGKPLPPLYGIPFSVKDSIDVAGVPTTVSCPAYTYTPEATATAVQLVLDAGAVFIGKVNLDQLATGLSGQRTPWPAPHSVFSASHISGGSSSGSATSVGSGLVSFSVATDTAGSTRVPAAFNGIVGFKPTKGTISFSGIVPAVRSMDCTTIIAPDISSTREVWLSTAVYDEADDWAKLPRQLTAWSVDSQGPKAAGFTFAVPPASALEVCSADYQRLFQDTVGTLTSVGGRLVEVDYGIFQAASDLLYAPPILYERVECIGADFLSQNMDKLHPVIRTLFKTAVDSPPSASDVFRDLGKVVKLTAEAQRILDAQNGGIDVLVVPSTTMHPTVAAMQADPIGLNFKLGTFTHFANIVDLCGVNVPAGRYRQGDVTLPFGVTLLGGSGYDARVLDIAAVLESARKPFCV